MLTIWLATGTLGKASGAVELTATGLTTGAASLGVPALTVTGLVPVIRQGGSHPRTTTYRSAPPSIVTVTLAAESLSLSAAGIGSPAMGQTHRIGATSLTTDNANTDAPKLTRSFAPNDNAFWFLAA